MTCHVSCEYRYMTYWDLCSSRRLFIMGLHPSLRGRLRRARLCCAVRGTFVNYVRTAQNYTVILAVRCTAYCDFLYIRLSN